MALTARQLNIVSSCFLFKGVDKLPESIFSLTARQFSAGEDIYTEMSFSRSVGLITRGRAVVYKNDGVLLNTLAEGDSFGVAALFGTVDYYVTTVRAKGRCDVVFISDTLLTELFKSEPATVINYITFLSDRIRFLNSKISNFAVPNTETALGMYLYENQCDGTVSIPGSYASLARQLNMGRASLYRSLEKLETEGVISRKEKTIIILKPEKLRKI